MVRIVPVCMWSLILFAQVLSVIGCFYQGIFPAFSTWDCYLYNVTNHMSKSSFGKIPQQKGGKKFLFLIFIGRLKHFVFNFN